MALTAQQVYEQSLAAQRGRVNQMYGRNLELLAQAMRDRADALEANVEGRGVARSGEANRLRSRLKEDEALQRRFYTEDQAYQLGQLDLDEQSRRAALASAGSGRAPSVFPTSRTPQDIYGSWALEDARQKSVAKGLYSDPYGLDMRRRFSIPGQGTR